MNFSIREIISRLLSPRHELSCSWWLWRRLLVALRDRGLDGCRESGAFLLGHRRGGRARVVDFILYDDLDPCSLETGIVRFDGRYFDGLWEACESRGLCVVADVHTHPGSSDQSVSDRAHPMISRAGHVAMIVPHFAARPVRRSEVGVYRYEGARRWSVVPARERRRFFHIGI
jgi:proteasome lid subunit RPN8/RPN11